MKVSAMLTPSGSSEGGVSCVSLLAMVLAGSHGHFLACGHIIPISAVIVTRPPPCLSLVQISLLL